MTEAVVGYNLGRMNVSRKSRPLGTKGPSIEC